MASPYPTLCRVPAGGTSNALLDSRRAYPERNVRLHDAVTADPSSATRLSAVRRHRAIAGSAGDGRAATDHRFRVGSVSNPLRSMSTMVRRLQWSRNQSRNAAKPGGTLPSAASSVTTLP